MVAVVVTGGAGFIGSHVCKALASAGYEPVVYDDLSRGNRAAVRFGPFVEGDIRDSQRLAAVLRRHEAAGIVHMAALAYVRESVVDPLSYYDNNVIGSIRILQAMRDAGVTPIVFSSTCATYGVARDIPIREGHPNEPINPYGMSKLMVERILRDAEGPQDVRSLCLRYFNVAGSDPDLEIGEWHQPETHVIPLCLMAARGEIDRFTMFGDDFDTADGTAVRDFIHVSDLARAHVLGLDYLLKGGESRILNVGIGRGYSVREVVETVEKVTGLAVPLEVKPRHPADPPVLIADGSAAGALLGFEPAYPELDQMVSHAWTWRQKASSAYGCSRSASS